MCFKLTLYLVQFVVHANKHKEQTKKSKIVKGISKPNLQIVRTEMKEEQKKTTVKLIVLNRGGEATPELEQLRSSAAAEIRTII